MFAAVIPKLAKGLLEQVGGVVPYVGGEQLLERVAAIQGEVIPVGEQRIAVAFDVAALLARQTPVFAVVKRRRLSVSTGMSSLAGLRAVLPEGAGSAFLADQDKTGEKTKVGVSFALCSSRNFDYIIG